MVHHHLDRPTVIVTIENVYTLCVLATASKGKKHEKSVHCSSSITSFLPIATVVWNHS